MERTFRVNCQVPDTNRRFVDTNRSGVDPDFVNPERLNKQSRALPCRQDG